MIVYNVTLNVDEDIHNEWLLWMKNEHLPEVMQTGKFKEYHIFKVLNKQADETGRTYAIQYFAETMQDYDDYAVNHAPALQLKTKNKFGDKVYAFRTLLEKI